MDATSYGCCFRLERWQLTDRDEEGTRVGNLLVVLRIGRATRGETRHEVAGRNISRHTGREIRRRAHGQVGTLNSSGIVCRSEDEDSSSFVTVVIESQRPSAIVAEL